MFSRNTTSTGNHAEKIVADYLQTKDHKVLDQNWRTRSCEIDIVTKHSGIVYFVEVKYRKNSAHGTGLEAITTTKLKQMTYAAENWVQKKRWKGDYRLVAASVDSQGTIELVEC